MCSITPPMKVCLPSRQAVDVAFDRVVQEAVQQHRRIVRHLDRFAHVALQVALLVHDFHRAAAQHVAGAHHQRIAQRGGLFQRFGLGARGGVRRLAQLRARAAASGSARGLRRRRSCRAMVPMIGTPSASRSSASLSGVWPPYCTITPSGFSLSTISSTSSSVSGSKYRRSRGVVVGRHGLGIAVDHDGLVAVLAHRQRGMHAAVVELDALADAVRPAAQHHDLLAVGRLGLALVLVGRVHVGGVGGELGGAGVDALVDRAHAQRAALLADRPCRWSSAGGPGAGRRSPSS